MTGLRARPISRPRVTWVEPARSRARPRPHPRLTRSMRLVACRCVVLAARMACAPRRRCTVRGDGGRDASRARRADVLRGDGGRRPPARQRRARPAVRRPRARPPVRRARARRAARRPAAATGWSAARGADLAARRARQRHDPGRATARGTASPAGRAATARCSTRVDLILDATRRATRTGSCERGHAPATPSQPDAFLVAAGDIADCSPGSAEITAALLDGLPGTVAALGDTVVRERHAGRVRALLRADLGPAQGAHAPGRREPRIRDARRGGLLRLLRRGRRRAPARAGTATTLGAWHVVALNSNCAEVGGCQAGSEQERWLRADLAANAARCTVAYMHHPRLQLRQPARRQPGGRAAVARARRTDGAELVLAGHDHDYERFAPQTADRRARRERGVRQFVVGTGGRPLRAFGPPEPNSEARDNTALRSAPPAAARRPLRLAVRGPARQLRSRDAGTAACH